MPHELRGSVEVVVYSRPPKIEMNVCFGESGRSNIRSEGLLVALTGQLLIWKSLSG